MSIDALYTAMDAENLPHWLIAYAQDCRRLFGIGDEWYISIKLVRAPGEDLEKEGQSRINVRYLTAHIELCESMSEEGLRHTLMHELLHVAFAPLELAHNRMRELVKEKHHAHLDELFADGLEQTIERLTRALEREIKPPAPASSEASSAAADPIASPGEDVDGGRPSPDRASDAGVSDIGTAGEASSSNEG